MIVGLAVRPPGLASQFSHQLLQNTENLVPSPGLYAKSDWSCQLPWPEWENGAGNNLRLSRPQSFSLLIRVSELQSRGKSKSSAPATQKQQHFSMHSVLNPGDGWLRGEKVHISSIYATHVRQSSLSRGFSCPRNQLWRQVEVVMLVERNRAQELAQRPWKMMRMKTRFHGVMGESKLELPLSFRTWGRERGARTWRGEWSIDSQVFRASSHERYHLNTGSQCNSYHLPTPPCDQPICFPTNPQGDLGRPVRLERRHRMELSRGDANRIHLPLYNYLWIFGYNDSVFFAPQFAGICRDRTLL